MVLLSRVRALALGGAAAACLWGCAGLFFYPERGGERPPEVAAARPRDLWITASDGVRLHGWVFEPDGGPRSTAVVFHGNAGNVATHAPGLLWLVERGHRVVLFDYRGYGLSQGRPDIPGIHRDAAAVLAWAFSRQDRWGVPVWVLGQSLGGAVAVYTVATSPRKDRLRLLVVDSAFAGYRRILREKLARTLLLWPVSGLLSRTVDDAYSPVRWIARVSPVPVLIVHGERDRVVPVRHARLLFEAAREPKGLWIARDAGHVGAFGNPELRRAFLGLLEARLAPRQARPDLPRPRGPSRCPGPSRLP